MWRYNWVDSEPKLVFKKALGGDIRSNWIEGELTGCVGIVDDSFTFIYVVNWVTLDEVYINTLLGVSGNGFPRTSVTDHRPSSYHPIFQRRPRRTCYSSTPRTQHMPSTVPTLCLPYRNISQNRWIPSQLLRLSSNSVLFAEMVSIPSISGFLPAVRYGMEGRGCLVARCE